MACVLRHGPGTTLEFSLGRKWNSEEVWPSERKLGCWGHDHEGENRECSPFLSLSLLPSHHDVEKAPLPHTPTPMTPKQCPVTMGEITETMSQGQLARLLFFSRFVNMEGCLAHQLALCDYGVVYTRRASPSTH